MKTTDKTSEEQGDKNNTDEDLIVDRSGAPIPHYLRPYCTRKFHGDGRVYYETPNERRRHERRIRGLFR